MMPTVTAPRLLASLALAVAALTPAAAAPQPSTLRNFLYFGGSELRLKGFQVDSGDLGSGGLLYAGGALLAPSSTLVADQVRLDTRSTCAALHANDVLRAAAGCGPATPVALPIVADLAAACGFPDPFPDCDPGSPVSVGRGGSLVLGPGVYGALTVAHEGRLILTGGEYVFCSFSTSRRSVVTAQAPTIVEVRDRFVIGPQGQITTAAGLAFTDLRVFVQGTDESVQLSHHSRAKMELCAPNGLAEVIVGSDLEGSFVADVIRSERGTGGTPGGESSTTTTSTTSTTSTTKASTTSTTKPTATTVCPTTSTTTTAVCATTTTTMPMCD